MVNNKDKEREGFKKALKELLSKPRKSDIRTFNKEFLEDYGTRLTETNGYNKNLKVCITELRLRYIIRSSRRLSRH